MAWRVAIFRPIGYTGSVVGPEGGYFASSEVYFGSNGPEGGYFASDEVYFGSNGPEGGYFASGEVYFGSVAGLIDVSVLAGIAGASAGPTDAAILFIHYSLLSRARNNFLHRM